MPPFKHGMHTNTTQKERHHKPLKYLRISAGPLRGQYVHRLVMEAKLGRPLTADETVDHEDGNSLNDNPSNLRGPITWAEHGRITMERERRKKEDRRSRKRARAGRRSRDELGDIPF